MKIRIGRSPRQMPAAVYILGSFRTDEVEQAVIEAIDAIGGPLGMEIALPGKHKQLAKM